MYLTHFHLSAAPFSLLPDSDFLFPSQRHKRVMNMLEYGLMTQMGFVVITGEVGAGKTTVLRHFIKNTPSSVTLGMVTNPSTGFVALLKNIVYAFDIPNPPEDQTALYQTFVTFLLDQYAKGKRVLLILDEAQNMPPQTLEELRLLSNVNNEKDQLLQTVLVGQPELLETLKQNSLRQFVQRIGVHCHLDPLQAAETEAYIRHRLRIAGGNQDLFEPEALAAIHYFSGGVPRLINLLCDQTLVYAFGEDKDAVSFDLVMDLVKDKERSGLSPFQAIPPKGFKDLLSKIYSEMQAV